MYTEAPIPALSKPRGRKQTIIICPHDYDVITGITHSTFMIVPPKTSFFWTLKSE